MRQKSGILLQSHVLRRGTADGFKVIVSLMQTDLKDVLQDVTLLGCLVDSNGSASDLAAIQHQVVMLAPDLNRTEGFIDI